ncbi:Lipid A biosynthesis lauroyl acyltransferase [Candidatus Zixiibacteriota bacterium]|nr:Lipid A biosynthesis lauroyl acyltransferase [candidate division Zixibacteria bacterium]
MRPLKQLKRTTIYYLIRLFIFIFNILPRGLAVFLGGILGRIAAAVSKKDRLKAMRNLELAFGEKLDETEKNKIVRNIFINFGRSAVDVLRFRKHFSDEIIPLVDIEGRENFDRVYSRGKGIIAVTGHLGNFELIPVYMGYLGYKVSAIGRELYDRRLDRLLVENREKMGVVNVDTRESPRHLIRLLREGYAVGVLIDTDSMRVRSMFVPAFGRPSNTPVGQTILGLKTGAAFIPLACVHDGNRYKLIIKPEVTIENSGNFEKDVYNMTKKCTGALEEIITEFPDQWIWFHDRWCTTPKEPIPYYDEKL